MIGAVDIRGTKIATGVFDREGKVIFREEFPTAEVRDDPWLALRMIRSGFERTGLELEGIGVSCTGPVYPVTGRVGNVDFLPGWEDFNLVGEMGEEFKVPVVLENDADAAAFGEWQCGTGRGVDKFVMITVGTGIGVGIILDGHIYRGADGSHPEFGHMVIETDAGPRCYCGSKGCWESLASGKSMEEWVKIHRPREASLNGREICELADRGDGFALAAIQRTARYLGVGIANIITTWMPQVICLSGGVMKSAHLFMPEINRVISTNCKLVPYEKVNLMYSILENNAALVGAALLYLLRGNKLFFFYFSQKIYSPHPIKGKCT